MGTGSFGGGSGSFFSGGSSTAPSSSSASGNGRASGSKSSGKAQTASKDSIFSRIIGLRALTGNFNKNPDIASARTAIFSSLQSAARRKYLVETLGDPLVNAVFQELFALNDRLAAGDSWKTIALRYGLASNRATLRELAYTIVTKNLVPGADERLLEISRACVADLFLKVVGDDTRYTMQPLDRIASTIDTTVFARTCNFFLASLVSQVVRRDLLSLSAAAKASIGTATAEIADRFVEKFINNYQKPKKIRHREMLKTIAVNYAEFAGDRT